MCLLFLQLKLKIHYKTRDTHFTFTNFVNQRGHALIFSGRKVCQSTQYFRPWVQRIVDLILLLTR